tara:strand:- start:41399 stop:43177 length:1779 start_codon:yes stop_codon:yes gene_type:complete
MNKKDDQKYYLGNKNLPRPDAEFEWTPEMINELKKSKRNILYFAENFFYIVNLDRGRERIGLYKCQKRVLRSLRDNRFVSLLASRQIGKTTLMTIYCLWIACFQEDQRILIVANKEQTAINIFKRVRLAYEMLPNHLKPGVVEYGKTAMALDNGSSIGISTTSSDAGRGDSCNVLVLDELAFIDDHLVQDFWRSVYPIISSSKKSKIFIASTPNGTENLFHEIYTNAEKGESNWKAERVDWWEIPGRDEEWKEETMKSLGSVEAFSQEFGNVFLQTGESVIDEELFERLKLGCSEPEFVFDEGKYLLWEEPKEDHLYGIGVDIAEGVGENASVVQVLDITDLTNIVQVAVYHNNTISPYNFTTKVFEIAQHWGSPPIAVERNNCGAQVVDNLFNQHGYSNLITFSPKGSHSKSYDNRLGVIAHTNTKYKGVVNMRYWVNHLQVVKFNDISTVNEMRSFVRYPNGTWAAKKEGNYLDDRVMSLIWSLIGLEETVVDRYYEIVEFDDNHKPKMIKSIDYGTRHFVNPVSMYSNEKVIGSHGNALPIVFTSTEQSSDIDELKTLGWEFPSPRHEDQFNDIWDNQKGDNMHYYGDF